MPKVIPKEGEFWQPVNKNYDEKKAVFKPGLMYVRHVHDVVYDRNTCFQKIFEGNKPPKDQMFFQLTKSTPTGMKTKVPANKLNLAKYNLQVEKRVLINRHNMQQKKR